MEGMKRHGWVVLDKEGNPATYGWLRKSDAEETAKLLDSNSAWASPHRAVELFYKDEQS